MEKSGSLRGGARPGSGRKKAPLEQRILEGKADANEAFNPQAVNLESIEAPKPRGYLIEDQRGEIPFIADVIEKEMFDWVVQMGCEKVVNKHLIELYAVSYARKIMCEQAISKYGFIAKHPTTGAPVSSPYVSIGEKYSTDILRYYLQINEAVKDNCISGYHPFSPDDKKFESYLSV